MKTILKEFVTDMTDYGTVFLIMANIQSREKRKYKIFKGALIKKGKSRVYLDVPFQLFNFYFFNS